MFHSITKVSLICIAVSTVVFSSSLQTNLFPLIHPNRMQSSSPVRKQISNSLAKKNALVWQKTGTTHYNKLSDSTDWVYDSRDTVIYDAAGRIILQKSSYAHRGWESDSLKSLDSSVYIGSDLQEEITMNYFFPGELLSGTRDIYNYPEGGKTIVITGYNWDENQETWQLSQKDTFNFSAPSNFSSLIGGDITGFQYSNYLSGNSFGYDTTNSTWKSTGYITKIPEECSATTLVLRGKTCPQYDSSTELFDTKETITFKTTDWSYSNIAEVNIQIKDSSSAAFHDYTKTVYSSAGWELSLWDSKKNSLNNYGKYLNLQDSHGNDTLTIYNSFNTTSSTWDTSFMYHYSRNYDGNGNNNETVQTYFSSFLSGQSKYKEVNTYTLADVPVVHKLQAPIQKKITFTKAENRFIFSSAGITGLDLYNASGRLISSIRQQGSPSITLDLSRLHGISSGTYIAEVIQANAKSPIRLSIMQ